VRLSGPRLAGLRLLALLACATLLAGAAAGCSTTQEKAAQAQARAKHILEARAERQKREHRHHKSGKDHRKGSENR
jgi:outer membrane lipoprotein-sorting protein